MKIRAWSPLILAAAIPGSLLAQQTNCPPLSLIHTHAVAHTRLPNTVADGVVGITADGATVAVVSKALSERSQKLMGFLRGQHAERLSTDQISVNPKMHTPKGGPDVIVGYTGSINVRFRTTVEKSADLISGALANGANTLEQVSFSPREEEIETARKTLAVEATKTAMDQAKAVAEAAGERVVSVHDLVVDPDGSTLRPMPMMQRSMAFAMDAKVAAPVAVEAGDQEVNITVNVDANIAP
jgi:uncharacterized protein YggE